MLHVVPSQVFFRPGMPISLHLFADRPIRAEATATIYHLGEGIAQWQTTIDGTTTTLQGAVPPEARRGYLAHVQVDGHSTYTAFDVLHNWTNAPRYGFVYDFAKDRPVDDVRAIMDHLLALHVNGLQFYDWQYRHDTLIPPQDDFVDPLGRMLSLNTVRALVDAAHERGMAAMPYTAIYAASPAFATDHPEWPLFDANRQPVDFANGFLKVMNPRGPWQAHFVSECRRVLDTLPFDGIHVDQYGEPKTGFDAAGAPVDLAAGFAETLLALRGAVGSDKAVLFNLVHNWPVEAIAGSPLDFWYSELWPPETDFRRLWQTIRDNRRLNPRPAVLAVYIPAAWEQTIIAAHSTILAAGGAHIVHGDHGRYLSDPYFPKAGKPSPGLAERLRQLADFGVAYEEALVFADDVTEEWITNIRLNDRLSEPGRLIVHASENRLFVNILNGAGRWDAELSVLEPCPAQRITLPYRFKRSWYASPAAPIPQPFSGVDLPPFSEWLLACFEGECAPDLA